HQGQPRRGARAVPVPRRGAGPARLHRQVRGGEVMRALQGTSLAAPAGAALRRAVLGALATLLVSTTAHAQSKVGTTFAAFTLLEPDARFAAMGMAGTAAAEGLTGAFYNPGSVGLLENHALEFVHADWIADVRYDWIAYGHAFGFGTLYASFTSLNSGDIA